MWYFSHSRVNDYMTIFILNIITSSGWWLSTAYLMLFHVSFFQIVHQALCLLALLSDRNCRTCDQAASIHSNVSLGSFFFCAQAQYIRYTQVACYYGWRDTIPHQYVTNRELRVRRGRFSLNDFHSLSLPAHGLLCILSESLSFWDPYIHFISLNFTLDFGSSSAILE